MPQNVETEMLLITSDDYWGHAGDFDPAVNFYPYTFIITQSQYASMDDSDKGRFFPCALFYYAGETDNHGFQPRRIGCRVEDNDTVSMGRVMGINRQGDQEVRTYRLGTEQGYAIPGYASMSMLKGEGDSYEAIESAAEAGSLPVGGFDISGLIYNQEAVVDTINTVAGIETDDSAAENFSAEEATPFEYDGAEPEAYVARPEATPVGYDVDDNSAAVEDYFASEGYNFNHTVGDFAQDSAAGSGYGVPEYYGTNSMSPMAFEAEVMYGTDGSVVGQAVGNWDSTPFGYQAEGDEGPEVMWEQDEFVSVRDGSARDAIADEYMDMGEDYDDAEDYARRAAKKMSAESDMTDEEVMEIIEEVNNSDYGVYDKYPLEKVRIAMQLVNSRPHLKERVMSTMDAEGLGDYTGPLTNGFGENSASVSDYGVPVWYGSAEEAYNGMGENSASISGQGVPQWYGSAEELGPGVGMPAVDDGFYPNSYGEDSSTFGQGVPQWYGSAEQGYNDKMDESLGMRHRGSHSQSMKDRRDEAAAMDKRHSRMGRKYDDVMTMDAEPVVKVQKSETKMAMAIGAAVLGALTAYTISRKVGGSEEPEEPEETEE
ncbi:hypothetical protein N9M17_00305 [bacterium]|jgi:hypothetical protein|nr:hypothetical protein [bacterium]